MDFISTKLCIFIAFLTVPFDISVYSSTDPKEVQFELFRLILSGQFEFCIEPVLENSNLEHTGDVIKKRILLHHQQ